MKRNSLQKNHNGTRKEGNFNQAKLTKLRNKTQHRPVWSDSLAWVLAQLTKARRTVSKGARMHSLQLIF